MLEKEFAASASISNKATLQSTKQIAVIGDIMPGNAFGGVSGTG